MTDQSMVERVCEEIRRELFIIGVDDVDLDEGMMIARAAIEAMREPTETMKRVFSSARPESPRTVWHETIDAALARSAGE